MRIQYLPSNTDKLNLVSSRRVVRPGVVDMVLHNHHHHHHHHHHQQQQQQQQRQQ